MKRKKPNPTLVDFESRTGLGPTYAAKLLGLPYISYAQYRSGDRSPKQQHIYHINALLLLEPKVLQKLIKELVYGNK